MHDKFLDFNKNFLVSSDSFSNCYPLVNGVTIFVNVPKYKYHFTVFNKLTGDVIENKNTSGEIQYTCNKENMLFFIMVYNDSDEIPISFGNNTTCSILLYRQDQNDIQISEA